MAVVYLDNNATTRVDPRVVQAVLPFFTESFGNASSTHDYGARRPGALKQARKQVQELLGAEFDHEMVFTSGGTESDTTAILSALGGLARAQRNRHQRRSNTPRCSVCQHLEAPVARGSTSSVSMPAATSTSTPIAPLCPARPRSSRSCGPITRPATIFPVGSSRRWPRPPAPCSIPTPCRLSARSRWR